MSVSKFLAIVCMLFLSSFSYSTENEPVCHHCEEIREYNAKYHQNYEYYDDYLKKNPADQKKDVTENENKKTKKLL